MYLIIYISNSFYLNYTRESKAKKVVALYPFAVPPQYHELTTKNITIN